PLPPLSLPAGLPTFGAAPVAVLSHAAWRRYFDGSPDALGRTLLMHATGAHYSIVGVMPPGLDFPGNTDLWASTIPARTRPGTDSDRKSTRLTSSHQI